jgi:hypothetical protein
MPGILSIENQGGAPIRTRNAALTPFSQALRIQLPGLPGGLVWNRPTSVLVVNNDGQEQVLPIQDVTRQIVWTLLGASTLIAVLFSILGTRKPERM